MSTMKTYPESPPLKKVCSSIIATHSMLPSTNFCLPLPFRSTASISASASKTPSITSLSALFTPPRKTNCVSSAILKNRRLLSRPPLLTVVSPRSESRSVILSWCPKSVSTYPKAPSAEPGAEGGEVGRVKTWTVRSNDAE